LKARLLIEIETETLLAPASALDPSGTGEMLASTLEKLIEAK
jgi:hypothetical protein